MADYAASVILLTGATGSIGSAVLTRLTARGEHVRCLVREPRRLGSERVRVQIALGDLSEPASFRNALRGVDTVIHLAAAIRDQQRAPIEELNAVATLRLLRAAERARTERFVFFSALGASEHAAARFMRSKALAERSVTRSGLATTVFAPSLVYSPGDPWMALLRRMTLLPALPVTGRGRALFEPICTGDVADCVLAALALPAPGHRRYELAGPERLSYDDIAREALHALHRRRRLLHVPLPATRTILRTAQLVMRQSAFATWEEAQLMEVEMVAAEGTADAESLGVSPSPMRAVLTAG